MKVFIHISILSLCFLLFSCQKEDDFNPSQPSCDTNNTGEFRATCTSNNPYFISIDGQSRGQIAGRSFQDFTLSAGTHSFYYEQVSGFLLYPTKGTTNISVAQCGSIEFIFP
jgi:hypothetical protein